MSGMATVYSSDCPAGLKKTIDNVYTFQCDGTADQTEINNAINEVMATGQSSTTKPTGGGGAVLLVGNNFNLSAPIAMQSWVDLSGAFGSAGCHLNAVSGFSGTGLIVLGQTYTEQTTVHDLYVDGQGIGSVHGIYYNSQTTQTPFTYADPCNWIHHLRVLDTGGAGIYYDGSCRVSHLNDVRVGLVGTYGFYLGGFVDSIMSDCQCLGSGSVGIYVGGADTVISNCHSDNSRTYGYQLAATRATLTGCQAEDSGMHNFYITMGKSQLSGCSSDSAGLNDVGDGFHFGSGSGVTGVTVEGCHSYDRNGTPHQRYGFYFDGSCVYSQFTGVTYGNATGSRGGSADGTGTTSSIKADTNGK